MAEIGRNAFHERQRDWPEDMKAFLEIEGEEHLERLSHATNLGHPVVQAEIKRGGDVKVAWDLLLVQQPPVQVEMGRFELEHLVGFAGAHALLEPRI
jgi:hypothetical protein